VSQGKKTYINKNFCVYFTHLPRSPPWGDLHKILRDGSPRRRNQPCQILSQSDQGFRFCRGANFWLSHRKEKSPLTQGLNYPSACDNFLVCDSVNTPDMLHRLQLLQFCRLQFTTGWVSEMQLQWLPDLLQIYCMIILSMWLAQLSCTVCALQAPRKHLTFVATEVFVMAHEAAWKPLHSCHIPLTWLVRSEPTNGHHIDRSYRCRLSVGCCLSTDDIAANKVSFLSWHSAYIQPTCTWNKCMIVSCL